MRDHWWWRPGWSQGRRCYAFHFTFAGQPAVHELAAEARRRLAALPALDLVPGRWLHLTTQGIGFAGEVSDSDLTAIASAARDRLTAVSPASVTVSAPRAVGEGVGCSVGPDGSLDPARNALRAAIAAIWGEEDVPEAIGWHPHIAFAYANAAADGQPYDAALAGLAPVTITLTAVDLIRLRRDRHVYEWETVTSLPLGH